MAELEHYRVPEGTLEIEHTSTTYELNQQFNNWMSLKNIVPDIAAGHKNVSSNLTNIISEILNGIENQSGHSKGGCNHSKGNGHTKGGCGFSKSSK